MKQFYMIAKAICFSFLLLAPFPTLFAQCYLSGFYDFGPFNGQSANGTFSQNDRNLTITNSVVAGTTVDAFVFNNTHKGDVHYGIYLEQSNTTPGAAGAKTKLVFSAPVNKLKFSLWDVDGSATKHDSVRAKIYSNGIEQPLVYGYNVTVGACVEYLGNNSFRGLTSSDNGSNCGDVNFSFLNVSIDSIVLFTSLKNEPVPNQSFSIGLGDISWCKNSVLTTPFTPGVFNFSTWEGQSANGNFNSTPASATVIISNELQSGATANAQHFTFQDIHKPVSGKVGVYLSQTSPSPEAGSKTKFVFDKALDGLKLSLFDIDGNDSVTVIAYHDGVALTLTSDFYALGACVQYSSPVPGGGNAFRGGPASANNEPCGDINIGFPEPVDSVVFYVTKAFGAGGALTITIDDISWSNAFLVPSHLKIFNASAEGDFVHVQWTTTEEINVHQYHLERSLDGRKFQVAGKFTPKSAGLRHEYQYIDHPGTEGKVFYRLLTLDKNQHVTMSRVLQVTMQKQSGKLKVLPNPVRQSATLSYSSSEAGVATITVSDGTGRTLIRMKQYMSKGSNIASIEGLDKFPDGIYQVRVQTGETAVTEKIIIRR
ncbi:MAG TPA: T9SS type A sorting domain-containing protein [Flavitalea sp.]|nr:T9SS type A sorting domain-containing protein [Flavitalea sp.]